MASRIIVRLICYFCYIVFLYYLFSGFYIPQVYDRNAYYGCGEDEAGISESTVVTDVNPLYSS